MSQSRRVNDPPRRLRVTPFTAMLGALAALLVISQFIVTSNFFERGSLSVLTPLVGIMVIVAIGQAFVMGTGGIDLSVAAVISLVGSIVLKQSQSTNSRLGTALVWCLVACVVVGLINGLLIEGLRLNALVVTLAVGQVVAGFTRIYRGGVLAYTNVPDDLSKAAGLAVGGVSLLLIAAVIMTLIATLFLHRVLPGRRLVMSSATPGTARLSGVRATRYRVFAYVIAACGYGIGGLLAAGHLSTPDLTLGDPYLLTSVVAVVLGGAALTGGRVSAVATLLGAAFVTILDYDLRVEGLSAGVRLLIQGIVLVTALSLSHGLQALSRLRTAFREKPLQEADQAAAAVS